MAKLDEMEDEVSPIPGMKLPKGARLERGPGVTEQRSPMPPRGQLKSTNPLPSEALSFATPIKSLYTFLTSPTYFTAMATILLGWECLLSLAIIHFVGYTEIDWSTYMQQVASFLNSERNYSLIKGDTGPIVYPAGFLYIYSILYAMTERGKDIRFAQYIFAQFYVVTLGMAFAIFRRCGSVPPYALIFITLSKRLHSIYMLRMFNDCIVMLFFYGAVLAWTQPKRNWTMGSVLFSLALSVKMNILLYAPAILYILFTALGLASTLQQVAIMASVQFVLAIPFLESTTSATTYFNAAFNFQREFLWEWTVNWRWIGEEAFLSKGFSSLLLIANVVVLILFGFRWSESNGGALKLLSRGLRNMKKGAALSEPSNDELVTILFTSNLIGILFARSLHYQFYAWYAHQLIFLAWHTPYDIIQRLAIIAVVEYSWNVFPSTLNSSMALTFSNAFLLSGVYYGAPCGLSSLPKVLRPGKTKHE